MNTFVVLHHYLHQNENPNMSMLLNSYITHPTRAGPLGSPAHKDVPLGLDCHPMAPSIFFYSSAYHSYYEIRNGNCNCWIMKKKGSFWGFTHYLHLPRPVDFQATCCHHLHPLFLVTVFGFSPSSWLKHTKRTQWNTYHYYSTYT